MRSVRIACVIVCAAVLPANAEVMTQTFQGTVSPSDPRMGQVGNYKSYCSNSSGLVPYEVMTFSPTVDGRHIVSLSTGETPDDDDYNAWHGTNFLLYANSFDPQNPATNCIGIGNTLPFGTPRTAKTISRILRADTTYVLVTYTRGFAMGKTVSYTLTVKGPLQTPLDFSGDGRTDLAVIRDTSGTMAWWIYDPVMSATSLIHWGIASDFPVPGDYDGDLRADAAVWRPGAAGIAGFWIRHTSDGSTSFVPLGQTGDDPTIAGDYDGDGKTDIAVFRAGAAPGQPNTWRYRRSRDGVLVTEEWGEQGHIAAPGDYDGDGTNDLAVRRITGGFPEMWMKQSTSGIQSFFWGAPTDTIVPGDFDSDGRTDMAVIRDLNGAMYWFVAYSSHGYAIREGGFHGVVATDFPAPAVDIDGRAEIAIWRDGAFWILRIFPTWRGLTRLWWGQPGDFPLASYNLH